MTVGELTEELKKHNPAKRIVTTGVGGVCQVFDVIEEQPNKDHSERVLLEIGNADSD